jgi:hypothetical protein
MVCTCANVKIAGPDARALAGSRALKALTSSGSIGTPPFLAACLMMLATRSGVRGGMVGGVLVLRIQLEHSA